MPGEEDVLVKQSVGSQSREPVKDNYDIAFSENNPSITFKDRAPQSSSDLKVGHFDRYVLSFKN